MPKFALNETIETPDATISVDPGLPIGQHRFQLEVLNEAGKRSRPDIAVVSIQREIVNPLPPGRRVVDPTRPPVDPIVTPVVAPAALPGAAAEPAGEAAGSSSIARRAKPRRGAPRSRRKE